MKKILPLKLDKNDNIVNSYIFKKFIMELKKSIINYENSMLFSEDFIEINEYKYKIINIEDNKNNTIYKLELNDNDNYYFLKKSKNILNANINLIHFYNEINIDNFDYWNNILDMQINDAFYEKNNILEYEKLGLIFENNFTISKSINFSFTNSNFKDDVNHKIKLAENDNNYYCFRIDNYPYTFILLDYLENSKTLNQINNIDFFQIYRMLLYIFSYANLNGYYHNDIKSNNILIKKDNLKINFNQLNNINLKFDVDYYPIIIDYSNSKKTNSCYPFDIYIISCLFIGKYLLSEAYLNDKIYIKSNSYNYKIIINIINIIENYYPDIKNLIKNDRLNSYDFYNSLSNDKIKYNKMIKNIFSFIY